MSQYRIYQTDADYRFKEWDFARDQFNLDDYKEVYAGELVDSVNYKGEQISFNEDDADVLENLYAASNSLPKWRMARSLSVGDVVEISRKDCSRYYYCDSMGWELVKEEPVKQNVCDTEYDHE